MFDFLIWENKSSSLRCWFISALSTNYYNSFMKNLVLFLFYNCNILILTIMENKWMWQNTIIGSFNFVCQSSLQILAEALGQGLNVSYWNVKGNHRINMLLYLVTRNGSQYKSEWSNSTDLVLTMTCGEDGSGGKETEWVEMCCLIFLSCL